MSNGHKEAAILWGESFANTIYIKYLDNWSSYPTTREGTEYIRTPSGIEDAWVVGVDYHLEVDARWIPTTGSNPTGWDGATGWTGFLNYARDKQPFRWVSDAANTGSYITSYLVEPLQGGPSLEPDGTKSIRLVMRNTGSAYIGY